MSSYEYKTPPFAHQRAALNKLARKDVAGLLMEAGTAKTKILLDNAAYLWRRGEVEVLAVLAPNGVHRQWIEEQVPLHLPDWCPRRVGVWKAGTKNRAVREALAPYGGGTPPLRVVAFNSEGLSRLSLVHELQSLLRPFRGRVLLAVDESHDFKTPGSKRTRNLWKLVGLARFRRIASGTELTKSPQDLYAQFRFLDWRILGASTAAEFRARYCLERATTDAEGAVAYKTIIGPNPATLPELQRRVAPYVFVAELKDCFDLPPLVPKRRLVPLTDEQRRLLGELRETCTAELASGRIVDAGLVITRLMKAQQIAAGHVSYTDRAFDEDPFAAKWEAVPTNGFAAVLADLDESRGKTLVWCRWAPDILQLEPLLRRAGIGVATYFGGNTRAQNEANKQRFLRDPATRVWLATYAAGHAGHNLQIATHSIYYSLTYDAVHFWQSKRRNYRAGQTAKVVHTTLVRPGSGDARILAALKRKEDLAAILRDPAIFKTWLAGLGREEASPEEMTNLLTPL